MQSKALVLLLYLLAESYLAHLSPPFFLPSMAIAIGCLAFLLFHLRKTEVWPEEELPDEKKQLAVLVVAVILLGCFFRLWKLSSLQEGMTFDEAYKGLDAIAIREFGERPIFLDWNGGREALVAYVVAFFQNFLDYSIVSVRIVTALYCCLSLFFFYGLTRKMFNLKVAVVATILLAFSKWHIIHSRYGVRAGQYMLFELAVLYFLARGFLESRNKYANFLLAGLFGGLGFHTYIAYRVFPIVVLAFLLERPMREKIRENLKPLAAALLVGAIIVAPLAIFYAKHFDSFTNRMQRTQVWNVKTNQSPLILVLDSAVKTFGMFTYRGDSIARHNVGVEPMFPPLATSLFLLGVGITLVQSRAPFMKFLLAYLLITLLPGVLSVGAPNIPRVLGSLPPAILFTSFGLFAAFQIFRSVTPIAGRIFLYATLAFISFRGVNDALFRYPAILDSLSPKIAELWGLDRDPTNVATLLNQLGDGCQPFLTPQFFFHSTTQYLTYSKSEPQLFILKTNLTKATPSHKVALIFLQPNRINPWWLRDDDGKRFFKWWNQRYGMQTKAIRAVNRATYDAPLTNTSDHRILDMLRARFPQRKEADFGRFLVIVVKP